MNKSRMLCAAAAMVVSTSALATDVGVSISAGQPGFYGRIDIGSVPQPPRLVYAQPIVIQPARVAVVQPPLYLHVPPGHAKHWAKHCARYNACGQPVYFVQDGWYNNVYVPYYRGRHHGYAGGAPVALAAPAPSPTYGYVPQDRVYAVPVTSVRAVVGAPEQRCWVERQQVVADTGPNVPGAIVGAVIGGVLGHQVGSGRGNDVATAGGAVAGAAIGANVGRGGTQVYGQDVQRCATVQSNARPAYWDVTYDFRGVRHRVQMTAPPGPTVMVDDSGAPRV
jgi:uncharacterized protein YcfJ